MSVEKNRLRPRALLTTCKRNEQALQQPAALQRVAQSAGIEHIRCHSTQHSGPDVPDIWHAIYAQQHVLMLEANYHAWNPARHFQLQHRTEHTVYVTHVMQDAASGASIVTPCTTLRMQLSAAHAAAML
eukprot:16639-Heterococcus_DN1.PRE.2